MYICNIYIYTVYMNMLLNNKKNTHIQSRVVFFLFFLVFFMTFKAFELQPHSLWRPAGPLGLGFICLLLLFVVKARDFAS